MCSVFLCVACCLDIAFMTLIFAWNICLCCIHSACIFISLHCSRLNIDKCAWIFLGIIFAFIVFLSWIIAGDYGDGLFWEHIQHLYIYIYCNHIWFATRVIVIYPCKKQMEWHSFDFKMRRTEDTYKHAHTCTLTAFACKSKTLVLCSVIS